jgi:hypothetical protein
VTLDPEALDIINGLIQNRFSVEKHARQRMNERGVQREDIREVARTYYDCLRQGNGRYRIFGDDLSQDPLDIVCTYDGEVIVVTVMGD